MTEVLTSLKSNVIDGLDNTAITRWPVVFPSRSTTSRSPSTSTSRQPSCSAAPWYSKLPENLQQILLEPRKLYTDDARTAIRKEDANNLALFPPWAWKSWSSRMPNARPSQEGSRHAFGLRVHHRGWPGAAQQDPRRARQDALIRVQGAPRDDPAAPSSRVARPLLDASWSVGSS